MTFSVSCTANTSPKETADESDSVAVEPTEETATPAPVVEESPEAVTVTDYDGNVYKTIRIGDQVWMLENLRCTHYSDGSPINYYELDSSFGYGNEYGLLYSSAVGKDIAPDGWHVPSQEEWEELVAYLGGKDTAGVSMMLSSWSDLNDDAIGDSGFSALPAGMYDFTGVFQWQGSSAVFASTTKSSRGVVYFYIDADSGELKDGNFHPDDAVSVRCVKDK